MSRSRVPQLLSGVICCALILAAPLGRALAQSDEPTPPKATSDEPTPPKAPGSDEPTPPKATSDEPTPPKTEEPAAPGAGSGEPGAGSGEPGAASGEEPKAPPKPEAELKKKKSGSASYGIGINVRAIFIHPWLLGIFLDESTPLNSMAFGGEFVRRKDNMDLIASVDLGFYSPTDGNYLGKNKSPSEKTDYVQFRGLKILSFSAHLVWHEELTRWMSFVYGVGAGIGIVLGDVYRISNDPARCTKENAGNIDECFPRGVDPQTREVDLARLTGGTDTPTDPHLFKEGDVPPVVPVIHFLVGFNFKVSEQVSIRVDGGFRDAFYFGVTSHWFL